MCAISKMFQIFYFFALSPSFFFKFSVSLKLKKYLPERIIQKPNTAVFQETNCIIHVIFPTLLKRNIQFPRNAWPWTEFENSAIQEDIMPVAYLL